MLQEDYSSKLIDIQDAIIEAVQHTSSQIHIYFSLKRKTHECPCCKGLTDKVHDYREQKLKDIPIQGKYVLLHYRKRRYRCKVCSKKFYEKLYLIPKRHRITNRAALYAVQLLRQRVSLKNVSQNVGVSPSSVYRWLRAVSFPIDEHLPKVVCIDEFRGNAGGEKYQCVITNLQKREVFDVLPTRKQEDIFSYLSRFKDKSNVKYVVMDMNRAYMQAVRTTMPEAKIIIDKFHVVRHCTWAFENVRKRIQKKLLSCDRKYFKHSRRLLLAKMKDLSDENKFRVERMLSYSTDLTNAYILKEYFYEFMASKSSTQAKERLNWLRRQQAVINLKEFENCFTMLRNWEQYILNAFDCNYTNGFTEGINNSIKVIKRVGFGYRNFETLRKRIMLIHHKSFAG